MMLIQTEAGRKVLPNLWLMIASAMLLCICPLVMAQKAPLDAPDSGAVTLIDDRGIAVKLNQKPLRIVTLLPSLGEIVCEMFKSFSEHLKDLKNQVGKLEINQEIISVFITTVD